MTLRYVVETKHKSAFTASIIVNSENDAKIIYNKLIKMNKKEGYAKYSNFILYDVNNEIICKFPNT